MGALVSIPAAVGMFLFVAAGVALVLAILPGSTIDMLGASLAVSLSVPLNAMFYGAPIHAWSKAGDPDIVWAFALTLFGGFFLWLGCVKAVCFLGEVSMGEQRISSQGFIDLTPEQAAEAFLLEPGKDMTLRRCGPADDNGLFEVSIEVEGFSEVDFTDVPVRHSYHARVMEHERREGTIRQITQIIFPGPDPIRSSVVVDVIEPEEGGSQYSMEEVHNCNTVLSWALFWLTDAAEDGLQAQLAAYKGEAPVTCMYGSQLSLMALIARWFVANGYAPENDPDA